MPETTMQTARLSPGGSRFQGRRVTLIALGHAAHDTYTAFLPPLLPLFLIPQALSKTEAGLLAVFLQVPWLLQPFIGHLADQTRVRAIVVFAPAVSAVMMSLLGIAPNYGVMVALLLMAGVSSAAFHAVGPALVARLAGSAIGRGMGLWMVGGELGRTLGPVMAVAAVQILTLEGLPWVMVGGIAASVLLASQFRRTEGVREERSPWPWRTLLGGLGLLMAPVAGIMLLRSFLLAALNLYLPMFLSEQGASFWLAGIALTVLEGAGVVGALLGGALSDRLGRRTVLAISLTTTPLLMFAFLGLSGWLQILLLVLLGLTGLSVTPVIMAIVLESFPYNRALANGVYMLLSFLIRSVAILSLGVLGDAAGLRSAYLLSGILALGGLPLLLLLPAPGRCRSD
jgi:FSR family fosmidomycin resistance protein-like MFS transporter